MIMKTALSALVRLMNETFCCIENSSRLSTAGLPVDTVWQGSHKVLFGALHDLLTHLVELLGVVDPTVKLCTCIRELCGTQRQDISLTPSEGHANLPVPDVWVRSTSTRQHSRSSICGFRACFFCLSVRSASSSGKRRRRVRSDMNEPWITYLWTDLNTYWGGLLRCCCGSVGTRLTRWAWRGCPSPDSLQHCWQKALARDKNTDY